MNMLRAMAKPHWEALILEFPMVVTEEGMTFEDFVDELRLEVF